MGIILQQKLYHEVYRNIKNQAEIKSIIGSEQIHSFGYLYALIPVGLGACIILIVALLVNNISRSRRYPEFWL